MRYGNVCTGIGAPEVAWKELDWEPLWFSEIAPFPCRLLNHYYPHVPNLGDMLEIEHNEIFQNSAIDLLVGGTPCQSFSTAGLRGGLADARGNLALKFCRILAIKRPRWFVWENVPGVFSVDKGEAFRSILKGFSECGYSVAWRVLDAQFFGVPQRRRRVFVVGYLGNDWRPPAAVLFEPEGMRGDIKEGRKAGKAVAGTVDASLGRSRGAGTNPGSITAHTLPGTGFDASEDGTGRGIPLVAGTIDASYGRLRGASGQDGGHGHSTLVTALTKRVYADNRSNESKLIVQTLPGSHCTMATGQSNADILQDQAPTLNCNHEQPIVWSIMPQNSSKDYKAREVDVCQPITTNQGISNNGGDIIQIEKCIRRLTPLECERLQGFPFHYTLIPPTADSPRYEALGNSMAVPVIRWIGQRINVFENFKKGLR